MWLFRGVWNVPYLSRVYLVKASLLQTELSAKDLFSSDSMDSDMVFCHNVRNKVTSGFNWQNRLKHWSVCLFVSWLNEGCNGCQTNSFKLLHCIGLYGFNLCIALYDDMKGKLKVFKYCTNLFWFQFFQGVFMYVTNMHNFGRILSTENYQTNHLHNDLWQMYENLVVSIELWVYYKFDICDLNTCIQCILPVFLMAFTVCRSSNYMML